jgi:hypothetical protein
VGLNETVGEPALTGSMDESGDDLSGAESIEKDLLGVELVALRIEGGQVESNTGRIVAIGVGVIDRLRRTEELVPEGTEIVDTVRVLIRCRRTWRRHCHDRPCSIRGARSPSRR